MDEFGSRFKSAIARRITGIGLVTNVGLGVGGEREFQVEAIVQNSTDQDATFDVDFEVDGTLIDEVTGATVAGTSDLDPVNQTTITSAIASADGGLHDACARVHNVDFSGFRDTTGTETDCVTFEIAVPEVTPTDLIVSPDPPWLAGDFIKVCVEFENTGRADGPSEVHDVFFNGSVVGSVSARNVPAGGTATDCILGAVPDT